MTQRTKKLEVGRTKIATVRAKYKGVSGNFDVLYGNICIPYVDGKMMILPKEKYLDLLKSFLKNEGVEYIAPTLEEASTIADRVWARYEETSRRQKEEELLKAEAQNNIEEQQKDVSEDKEPEENNLPEPVHEEISEQKPVEDESISEEVADYAYQAEESKREEEINEVHESVFEYKHEETNFVDTMSTKIAEEVNSAQPEEDLQSKEEEEIVILDCEPETRFEKELPDEAEPEDQQQGSPQEKEGTSTVTGINETDLFDDQQEVATTDESLEEKEEPVEESSDEEDSPVNPMQPSMSEELINDLKRMIQEQNVLILNDQALMLRKIEANSDKLDELMQDDKSIELNFDLNGLEKEFKKMNRKISGMKWACLLSLVTSLLLGAIAGYFGLGYGDTITLRNGEDVELHAIVHGAEGDTYSLLGTLSVDESGEVIVEPAD